MPGLRVLLALALTGAAAPVDAHAATRLTLDPSTTRVLFELGATMHTVRGTAKMTEGVIVFDPATGEASGRVRLDARSLESGNASRDRTMHAEVLESERFPDVVLVPDRLEGAVPSEGEADVTLSGTLEIHGGRHPVRIPASVSVSGGRLTGRARFDIPYVAWGMKDPSAFLLRVKKEVGVTLELSGSLLP